MVSVSCFGVRVSVTFHFMFVHYTFSSVWVAEWPARLAICSHCILSICNIYFISRFGFKSKFCLLIAPVSKFCLLVAPVPVHCFSITFTPGN